MNNKQPTIRKRLIISIVSSICLITMGCFIGIAYSTAISDEQDYSLENQINDLTINDIKALPTEYTYIFDEASLSELYDEVKDSIVVVTGYATYQSYFSIQYGEVQGSGFVYQYEDSMVVITNYHVVSGVENIIVTFSNGNGYSAEICGSDAYSDLAVLTVDAPDEEFNPLTISSSSYLEVGDPVIAIGSPMGLSGTMTTGIISQLGRSFEESLAGNYAIANIIQTSVAINPGNSGGPLLNYQGEVIGITTAIIEDSEGLGFAIPSNTILREIDSLMQSGVYTQHAWLGVSGVDMSYALAQYLDIDTTYGWLIISISSGSAAAEAGLIGGNTQIQIYGESYVVGGDVILAVDGFRVINGDDLMSYLVENTSPDQIITLTILRDDHILNVSLELGIRPTI